MSAAAWWMLGLTWSVVIGVAAYLFTKLARKPGGPPKAPIDHDRP